jgi:hypothetical protein
MPLHDDPVPRRSRTHRLALVSASLCEDFHSVPDPEVARVPRCPTPQVDRRETNLIGRLADLWPPKDPPPADAEITGPFLQDVVGQAKLLKLTRDLANLCLAGTVMRQFAISCERNSAISKSPNTAIDFASGQRSFSIVSGSPSCWARYSSTS